MAEAWPFQVQETWPFPGQRPAFARTVAGTLPGEMPCQGRGVDFFKAEERHLPVKGQRFSRLESRPLPGQWQRICQGRGKAYASSEAKHFAGQMPVLNPIQDFHKITSILNNHLFLAFFSFPSLLSREMIPNFGELGKPHSISSYH